MAIYKISYEDQYKCGKRIKKSITDLKKENGEYSLIRTLFSPGCLVLGILGGGILLGILFSALGVLAFLDEDKLNSLMEKVSDETVYNIAAVIQFMPLFLIFIFILFIVSCFNSKKDFETSETAHSHVILDLASNRTNEVTEVTDEFLSVSYLYSRRRNNSGSYSPAVYRKAKISVKNISAIVHAEEIGVYIIFGNPENYFSESDHEYPEYSYASVKWHPFEKPESKRCIAVSDLCENTETGMKDIGDALSSLWGRTPAETDIKRAVNYIWKIDRNEMDFLTNILF